MPDVAKRFQTRMPFHVHEKLMRAAELSGATLNQFVVQSALEKANLIIEQERLIALTDEEAAIVFEAVENPPEPNENLRQAARIYQREFFN